jgi:hypothetical protein
MLDPKFKILCLISPIFYDHEKSVTFVEEYDKISLYLMFIKCHHYLHIVTRFEISCQNPNKNCGSNIFEQIASTNELMKKLVGRKLLIFKRYQVHIKNIKCPLQWREKHKSIFLIIDFWPAKY